MSNKIEALKNVLNDDEEIIITDYYQLFYFAGFKLHVGERLIALVISKKQKPVLLLNDLFPLEDNPLFEIVKYNDVNDPIELLSKYLNQPKIYVDDKWTSGFLLRLMEKYPANYYSAKDLFVGMRLVKDEEEKAFLIQASKDNDMVMEKLAKEIHLGMSEKELYNIALKYFEEVTHSPVSFDPIVAFGKNAADPHHMSDDTILKEGDVCLIDMGSTYHGYCSDMTRTFLQKNEKMEEIYEIVKNANLKAEAIIKPGVKYSDIDKAARDYISSFGYGQYFTHRLGHGIGLEVHEGLDVSSSDNEVVQKGHIFSIEPGIYLADVGGVRIEDLVIVTDEGCLVLNSYSKEKQFI